LAAVSDLTASELAEYFPGVPIVVTPNAVDTVRFHPDAVIRSEVRSELGLGDEVVVLFVGGDFERKGLGVAIESLVNAPQVTLVAAGPGDLERASTLAKSLGVENRVLLLGKRSDVNRLGAMADLFLCASIYEAAALALLEAAASGLALVSTKVGNAPEIVGEGDDAAGVLVDRDPKVIGHVLEELATDPDRRRRYSEAALDRVGTRSWDVVAHQVLDLYRQLGDD
jgi:UDP-glucose:(heptosyl)LPS alpha-1,3-glucosyltransferase